MNAISTSPTGRRTWRIRLRAAKKLRTKAIGTASVVAISARKMVSTIFSITVSVVSLKWGRPSGQLPSTSIVWYSSPPLRRLGTVIAV